MISDVAEISFARRTDRVSIREIVPPGEEREKWAGEELSDVALVKSKKGGGEGWGQTARRVARWHSSFTLPILFRIFGSLFARIIFQKIPASQRLRPSPLHPSPIDARMGLQRAAACRWPEAPARCSGHSWVVSAARRAS